MMAPGAALGFRGVLLRLAEADEATPAGSGGGGSAFRVLAPDAEMALPAAAACGANALSARATQALVVSDRVSARLLQRTGCSAALLQRETRSALWVEVAAGGDTPAGSGRCCYCFQFRSGVEFDMFERAVRAFLRAQQLALVENSVLLELELEAERQRRVKQQVATTLAPAAAGVAKKKKSQLSRAQGGAGTAHIAAAAARSVQRSRSPVASAVSTNGALAKAAAPKTKLRPVEPVVREQQPQQQLSTACILCDTKAQSGKPLSMHPFVLQVGVCMEPDRVCKSAAYAETACVALGRPRREVPRVQGVSAADPEAARAEPSEADDRSWRGRVRVRAVCAALVDVPPGAQKVRDASVPAHLLHAVSASTRRQSAGAFAVARSCCGV